MYANFVGIIYSPAPKVKEVEVTSSLPIKTTRTETEGVVKFHIEYYEYKPPTMTFTVNPSVAEVGSSVNAAFSGTFKAGSEPISHVTVTPESNPTVGSGTLTFTKTITSEFKGTHGKHTMTVFDTSGKSDSREVGVKFQHRYRYGFIPRGGGVNDFVQAGSKLADSIKGAYGSDTVYTFPSGDNHIAWLLPIEENITLVTGDANMEWTTLDAGQVTITNGTANVVYRVVRTLGDYPGSSEPVTLRIAQ